MTIEISEPRSWRAILAGYQSPSLPRSIVEIILSAAPLAALWIAGWVAAAYGLWWLALLLAVPAAGFLVRLFMIQHDCGHHALFKSAWINDWVGRALGVLTLTPYDHWRQEHAIHHATSGDLDRRGMGAVHVLTVEEYRALSFWGRLRYRLYRHPLVLFGLGPAFVFILQYRLPVGLMRAGWRPWVSAIGTNIGIAMLVAAIVMMAGWRGFLFVHLPSLMIAASIGVWLFYVQHQFEHTYWARHENWQSTEAALHGSSYYDLPDVLHWLTGNIGVHHVHHINSRIPFYRLPNVLADNPELKNISLLSVGESIRTVSLALWDEASQSMISFGQFKQRERARA